MHAEHLVVSFRPEEILIGACELQAKDQRFDAADYKKRRSCGDVAFAELFMVDRRQPSFDCFRRFPQLGKPLLDCSTRLVLLAGRTKVKQSAVTCSGE